MEDYPPEYTEHNLPLIYLSGLVGTDEVPLVGQRQANGTRISAEQPSCNAQRATILRDQFANWDGSEQPWNATALPGPVSTLRYRFKSIARSFTVPARKAAPLPQSPSTETIPVRQGGSELHSPLSPLSPGSTVYPDGVIAPAWFAKHQSQVPCLVLAFFDLSVDSQLEDDAIKADINAMKTALLRSGYRTRFAAVLLGDSSIIQSPELEERFQSIRRATSLDAKSGIFFVPPMPSDGEVATFIQGMLTSLQPQCIEYYRELTKHARRKKSRSTVPQSPTLPHITTQSLPIVGWNARYELKQAVFAEFRQEMDVAERHYTSALEDLCSTEGLLETSPNWSPRWDETRLISDSIAIRIIRCHLWNGSTTTAAHFWHEYKLRTKYILDTKGKGTQTYGWLAWEARWARIMAQLIQLAKLSMLEDAPKKNEPPVDLTEFFTYSRPERAFAGVDAIPPHVHLHHSGYWNRLALECARARYKSALAIPDEDRVPPGQSPASSVAGRAQAYDTYLVPEPHEEYLNALDSDVIDTLQLVQMTDEANQVFVQKGQHRMSELLSLDLADDLITIGLKTKAMDILQRLWQGSTWREERWHTLFEKLLSLLYQCATATKNVEVVAAVTWELRCLSYLGIELAHDVDITQPILSDYTLDLEFTNNSMLSPLAVSFAFDEANAYASEQVRCQLVLTSAAPSLIIDEVQVILSNGHQIEIVGSGGEASSVHNVPLSHDEMDHTGTAPLKLTSAGPCILNFDHTFQDSGSVSIAQVQVTMIVDKLHVVQKIDDASLLQAATIHSEVGGSLRSNETRAENTTAIEILPKPPKVEIKLIDSHKQHYAGELVKLKIELRNDEAVDVSGTLSFSIATSEEAEVAPEITTNTVDVLSPGDVFTTDSTITTPQLATQLTLSVTFVYTLDDSRKTMLIKTLTTDISLLALLEPKWSFGPLLHAEPWPSYFDPSFQESRDHPAGIPQRWKTAFTAPLPTADPIIIHKTTLRLDRDLENAVCTIMPSSEMEKVKDMIQSFDLTTTRITAEDRRPLQLLLACEVEWSRTGSEQRHSSSVPVPRITLPTSEPRVLCTVSHDEIADAVVEYHLENPSNHFLTFSLAMQATDDFAFSGAKYRTMSLAPMSRVCVPFSIMLHDSATAADGDRWIYPNMECIDSYYQKTLRIQAAGPDVMVDAQNGLAVFVRRSTLKAGLASVHEREVSR